MSLLRIHEDDIPKLDKLVNPFLTALYMAKHGKSGTAEEIYYAALRGGLTESVYFVEAGGLVKIGFSVNPLVRARSLQTASPAPVRLLATQSGDRELERKLHRRFRRSRLHGEWFKFTQAVYWYIMDHTTLMVDPGTFKWAK